MMRTLYSLKRIKAKPIARPEDVPDPLQMRDRIKELKHEAEWEQFASDAEKQLKVLRQRELQREAEEKEWSKREENIIAARRARLAEEQRAEADAETRVVDIVRARTLREALAVDQQVQRLRAERKKK